jgi:hypothetical protein
MMQGWKASRALLVVATSLLMATPALAQEAGGPWQGGYDQTDTFPGCAFTQNVADGFVVAVYRSAASSEPTLEIRKPGWNLLPGQSFNVRLRIGTSTVRVRATQVRSRDIATVLYDRGDVLDALVDAESFTIDFDEASLPVDLTGTEAMAAAFRSCTEPGQAGAGQTATPGGFNFDSALSQLSARPVAGYTCLISGGEMYGILTSSADDTATTYLIEVFEDGSMNFQGSRIEPGHRQFAADDATRLEGAAYDVRLLSGAGQSYELPPSFGNSGQEFAAFMQEYTTAISGAVLGDRQRWLVINVDHDIVTFSDIGADGTLSNTIAPECYRTR